MDKKSQVNDFSNLNEMVTAHRGVLKSLIDKDGFYKSGEAVEINNGLGKQLSFLNLLLDIILIKNYLLFFLKFIVNFIHYCLY